MSTSSHVAWALSEKKLSQDPTYVREVLSSYVRAKNGHGHPPSGIERKLDSLETSYPQYAQCFHDVRRKYGLAPSKARPPLDLLPSITPFAPAPHDHQSPHPTAPGDHQSPHTSAPEAGSSRETPPPPYTLQDPAAEAARIPDKERLERLARERLAAMNEDAEIEEAVRRSLADGGRGR
ncbi:hypothetical protein IAT38_006379 [Cryptococcus sp. DSM 104549]